jgi:2-methylisocitrate lyase-like PEP mutase family enzyme
LGVPDLGLLGLDDVARAVRRIGSNVGIPIIADIDTGFGGPLNVRRTVVEVEAEGAAAVQIEDEVTPKRCRHSEDKEIVVLADRVGVGEAIERSRQFVGARPVTLRLKTIGAQRAALDALSTGTSTVTLASVREVVGADVAVAFHASHRPTVREEPPCPGSARSVATKPMTS